MKSKQRRKDEALKAYEAIIDPAYEVYQDNLAEIDETPAFAREFLP